MNKFIKGLINQKPSSGFTLVELMVAMLITSLVISATGFGLVSITNKDKREKAETQRRVELNRALDFIADEVRQAKPIATDASANLSTIGTLIGVAPDFSSSGKTPVLTLQIPGVSQRVIYYIAPKETGSVWLGPNIVYRWGPNFNNSGTYSNPTNPANWTYQPLADLILNSTPNPNNNCPDPDNNPATTADNWKPNPAVASRTGFYACVDPSGKIADIHLRGKLTDAYGNTIKDNTGNDVPLEVSSKVFARPYNPPFALSVGSSSSAGNGGTITVTQPSNMYIEVLGGSVSCGAAGALIPTTTTIHVTTSGGTTTNTPVPSGTKALNLSAAVGTTLTVTGTALSTLCVGADIPYNSNTANGTQVLTLRNGDSPPLFNPFGSQPSIDSFMTKYLDQATGKVKLAENQVIFLFEFSPVSSGGAAYDMQDLVVLATVTPKN